MTLMIYYTTSMIWYNSQWLWWYITPGLGTEADLKCGFCNQTFCWQIKQYYLVQYMCFVTVSVSGFYWHFTSKRHSVHRNGKIYIFWNFKTLSQVSVLFKN